MVLSRRGRFAALFFILISLGFLLAAALGVGPLASEGEPHFFPPAAAIEQRPRGKEAWDLIIGDSVLFACAEHPGPCADRVLDRLRACRAAAPRLASIAVGGQTPFQFEAEAYRCTRLFSKPRRVYIEFTLRPYYYRYDLIQRRRRFPPLTPIESRLDWDEDPFDSVNLSPAMRAWSWWAGLNQSGDELWAAAGIWAHARLWGEDPTAEDLYHYRNVFGRGRRFEPAALEAVLRAGQRLRQNGAEVSYFAVPQNWPMLEAQLRPSELQDVREQHAAALARLRQEGFQVIDLSRLLEEGFEPPPTQHEHLVKLGRERFSPALCQALR